MRGAPCWLVVAFAMAGCSGGGSPPMEDASTIDASASDAAALPDGSTDAAHAPDTNASDTSTTDGGVARDAGGDTANASDAGAAIVCTAHSGGTFPTFDRGCTVASDCVIVRHQTNCCGDSVLTGIRASERAAFDAAEATCEAMYPACGCASHPGVTDSGEMEASPPGVSVTCAGHGGVGMCFTYVSSPPP